MFCTVWWSVQNKEFKIRNPRASTIFLAEIFDIQINYNIDGKINVDKDADTDDTATTDDVITEDTTKDTENNNFCTIQMGKLT